MGRYCFDLTLFDFSVWGFNRNRVMYLKNKISTFKMSSDESFIETKDSKNVNNSQENITKTIKELIYQLGKVSDFNRFLYDRVTELNIKIFTLVKRSE